MARPTRPPTTPPAMAPELFDDLAAVDAGAVLETEVVEEGAIDDSPLSADGVGAASVVVNNDVGKVIPAKR